MMCEACFLLLVAVLSELLPQVPGGVAASGSGEQQMFSSGAFGFNLVLPSRPLTPTSPCMEATVFQQVA